MTRFKNFCGSSYTLSNQQYELQRSVNLYPEWNELLITGKEGELKHMPYTPALTVVFDTGVTTPPGPSRGKFTMSNGICISIFGNTIYQITGNVAPLTYTSVGTLLTSTGIISQLAFADNGTYFMMTDGTYGYAAIIDSGSVLDFGQVTDSVFVSYGPTSCCQYYNGYFVFNQVGTNNFFWSNLNQPTFGGATPTAGNDSKIGNTDPIQFLCVIDLYLWLVGTQTSEVWYFNAQQGFIAQRIPGPYIEAGCVDPNTAQKTENGLFWLSNSLRGNLQVVITEGENITPISTQETSRVLAQYPSTGWSSLSYGDRQHMFYFLNPPGGASAASSWVYDYTASQFSSQNQWHERTYTDPVSGLESRHRADNHCFYKGYHILGDYNNALDYYFDYNSYTDNGAPITRRRRSPYFSNDMTPFYTDLFQLDIQGGVGLVWDAVNSVYREPLVTLNTCDDGYNWHYQGTESIGGTGEYIQRCQFWQCGLSESGYRAYEVVITDPIPVDIIGASLKITMGIPY